jgi:hypothetical protein
MFLFYFPNCLGFSPKISVGERESPFNPVYTEISKVWPVGYKCDFSRVSKSEVVPVYAMKAYGGVEAKFNLLTRGR